MGKQRRVWLADGRFLAFRGYIGWSVRRIHPRSAKLLSVDTGAGTGPQPDPLPVMRCSGEDRSFGCYDNDPIEAVFRAHSAVADALALEVPNDSGWTLAVFVKLRAPNSVDARALEAHYALKKKGFTVPRVVITDELPSRTSAVALYDFALSAKL
jgi:hypothetical protein